MLECTRSICKYDREVFEIRSIKLEFSEKARLFLQLKHKPPKTSI